MIFSVQGDYVIRIKNDFKHTRILFRNIPTNATDYKPKSIINSDFGFFNEEHCTILSLTLIS